MATRKNVPAARVREWARSDEGTKALTEAGAKFPGSRGRLDPSTLAVFHKANPRERYETASEAEKPTVTVAVKVLDKIGRATTRKVTITTDEARDLLGQRTVDADGKARSKRGRFNMDDLALALEAKFLADA